MRFIYETSNNKVLDFGSQYTQVTRRRRVLGLLENLSVKDSAKELKKDNVVGIYFLEVPKASCRRDLQDQLLDIRLRNPRSWNLHRVR